MLKLYNTLTKTIGEFEPREPGKVQIFVCGPTVYDYIHIGNARTFVFFDVVARCLRHKDYDVNYIQNITDIDDKIIKRAQEEGVSWSDISKKYTEAFREDMKALGITSPTYKKATDYIPEIINQVKRLKEKGHAYLIENDPSDPLGAGGWYFDVKTFREYGKLSGRTAQMAEDGVSRIDESDKKRNKADFCLWKLSREGEPAWDFETGKYLGITGSPGSAFSDTPVASRRSHSENLLPGRPGWHIEDTAITEMEFGPQYDIHGGGMDLLFPHHEAELTQQESASGKSPFVKYWMHVAFLVNKEKKMAKSEGNFTTLHDLLKEYSPEAIRFYLLSAHYRSPLDFSEKSLNAAEAAYQRIRELRNKAALVESFNPKNGETFKKEVEMASKKLENALDSDFNIPVALGITFNLIAKANVLFDNQALGREDMSGVIKVLNICHKILGIAPSDTNYDKYEIPPEIQELRSQREVARVAKDFAKADELRKQIENLGYSIDDTPYGPLVKKRT